MADIRVEALRNILETAARRAETMTYAELASQLNLCPPHIIHRTTRLLEDLMRDQAKAGEPQLSSFVVSRARAGVPAPGFFILMRELGLYDGPYEGVAAHRFIVEEQRRCLKMPD